MKALSLLLLPLLSFGLTLSTVLEKVQKSDLIQSKRAQKEAQEMQLQMLDSSYMPRVDASANYRYLRDEDRALFDPLSSVSLTASYILFDGLRHSDLTLAQQHRIKASSELLEYEKASLSLASIRLFFNIRTQKSVIEASEQKIKQLYDEKERLQRLYDARIVQEDALESVKAALAMSEYELQMHKQNHRKMLFSIHTLTGLDVSEAEVARFKEPNLLPSVVTKNIQAQEEQIKALGFQASAQTSPYLPKIVLQDTISQVSYYESALSIPNLTMPERVNKLEVVATLSLVDFSALSEAKQKMLLEKKAMQAELDYAKKALSNEQKLSKMELLIGKEKMRSALLNLKASQKSYEFREKSFKANLIDSTIYLDALTRYTQAKALYEQSQNDYEIAKAYYYFKHNIPLKEQLQ